MFKHIYLVLTSTFILGFFSGIILFLYNNTGNEGNGALPADTAEFTIIAYMYGGCVQAGGCPSYRILEDGSYLYITRDREKGEERYEDALSSKQYDTILSRIQATDFASIKNTKFTGACPIAIDGVAFRYDITVKGTRYEFDSCVENLAGQPFFETLEDYFSIFEIALENV